MPLYDYKCHTCGRKAERFLRLADMDQIQSCAKCGFAMERQVSAPMVLGDYPPYDCPVTGKIIEGRAAHRENLARTGCRILEPGESAATARYRREADEALDKAIEETADRFITSLPTDKRDKLAAEMDNGLGVEIVRQTPEL